MLMKMLEDATTVMVLKAEGADMAPSKADALIRETISRLIHEKSDEQEVTATHIEDLPRLPAWFAHRPGLSDDFVALNRLYPVERPAAPALSAPIEVQEQALVDDFLNAMMGVEGQYLELEGDESGAVRWRVNRSVTPLHDALVGLVERMLPLCECYVEVNKFVDDFSEFESGLIAHAIAAAISRLLSDYLILVGQLEQLALAGRLSLQKIWYNIQQSLDMLTLLRDFTREARFYRVPSKSSSSSDANDTDGDTETTTDAPQSTPDGLTVKTTIVTKTTVLDAPLSHLPSATRKKFGAELLNLLHDRWMRTVSDKSANSLFFWILQNACVPYWEMLKSWIYKGFVKDPYGEFFVDTNTSIHGSSETYWEKKYTLRHHQVPVFLDSLKEKILTTGKYINAIRECASQLHAGETTASSNAKSKNGSDAPSLKSYSKHTLDIGASQHQQIEDFVFTANERQYAEKVDRAYQYASGRLLHVLRTEYGLMSKLRSVKHYFLLDQGDFFIHFMDVAEDELKPPASNVLPSTLQTLVDIAIRASVAKDDELGESMKIQLLPFNLINQLIARHKKESLQAPSTSGAASSIASGVDVSTTLGTSTTSSASTINNSSLKDLSALEALTLDWQVTWPLVLIFNRNTIDMYQIMFRHLFYCKHVERILGRAWTQHQLTKMLFQRRRPASESSKGGAKRGTASAAPAAAPAPADDAGSDYHLLTRCFSLRQRMLHFIQNLQYYMVMEVIEPRFLRLEDTLRTATTVDELLAAHSTFLDECLRNCLLTEMDLFKIITKILSVCVIFCNYTERFIKQLTLEHSTAAAAASTASAASNSAKPGTTGRSKDDQRNRVISLEGRKILSEKGFGATMSRFEANFDKYYRMLMEATTTFQNPNFPDHGLLALNIRLDFNDFYSTRFQQ